MTVADSADEIQYINMPAGSFNVRGKRTNATNFNARLKMTCLLDSSELAVSVSLPYSETFRKSTDERTAGSMSIGSGERRSGNHRPPSKTIVFSTETLTACSLIALIFSATQLSSPLPPPHIRRIVSMSRRKTGNCIKDEKAESLDMLKILNNSRRFSLIAILTNSVHAFGPRCEFSLRTLF